MKLNFRPLTALAITLSALGLVQVGSLGLNATKAFAETKAKEEPKAEEAEPAAEAAATTTTLQSCLPVDLAKEAGISAAEFRLLQSLQDRRQLLDDRERDIITREGIIKTADDIVRARIATLQQVEANIERLLGQVDELEAQRLAALVRVYEKMKPKDAAKVMEGLSDEVVVAIASRMKEQSLALILGKMAPARAREITTLLAQIDEAKLTEPSSMASNTTPPAATPPSAPKNAAAPTNNAPPAKAAPSTPSTPAATPAANNNAPSQAPQDPPAAGGAPKAKR